jgi:hypothetical protein
MRAISGRQASVDSEADSAKCNEEKDDLAASDGESSDDYRLGNRAQTSSKVRILPDFAQDPQAEAWREDLENRRVSLLDPRSSFSSSPCMQKMIRNLPESSFLAGRPVFESTGLVNLHLLAGAYVQLASSAEAWDSSADARHILWLAEAARSLGVLSLNQLRRGKLAAPKSRKVDAAPDPDTVFLAPDREVRFPARPLAAGKRKGDGEGFFSDDEDAMEQFVRRKRAVLQLRSKNNDRQAHIASHSSHDLDMAEVRNTLTAPTFSFDWNSKRNGAEGDEDDDDDDVTLEVSVPENNPEGFSKMPSRDYRRGLFKDAIQRSISRRWAEGLKGEDDAPTLEAEGQEEGVAVRATRRKHVLVESHEDPESDGRTTVPADSSTPSSSSSAPSPENSSQITTPESQASAVDLGASQGPVAAQEIASSAEASKSSPSLEKLVAPYVPEMITKEKGEQHLESPEVAPPSQGTAEQSSAPCEERGPSTPAVIQETKTEDSRKQARKMKQALLLDMFKRSFSNVMQTNKMTQTKALEASTAASSEGKEANSAATEVLEGGEALALKPSKTDDVAQSETLEVKAAPSRLKPLSEASLTLHSIEIEEADGRYRACCRSPLTEPGASPSQTWGPWRSTAEKARADGEIMFPPAEPAAPAEVPEAWTTALEGAFPALRRLRRLSAADEPHGSQAEESDGAEEYEDDEEEDESDEQFEEDTKEVVLTEEFLREHRMKLRRRRRKARRLDRKLRWELSDVAEIRDEVTRMVSLGTSTMSSEEQRRWQQLIDATFAAPASGPKVSPAVRPQAPTDARAQLPSSKGPCLLFGGRREDDGGDVYSLAGKKPRTTSLFLKSGPMPVIEDVEAEEGNESRAGRIGQTFLPC